MLVPKSRPATTRASPALSAVPIIGPGLAAAQWAKMGKKRSAPPQVSKGGEKVIGATDKSTGRGASLALTNVATDAELQAVHDWTQRELDADESRLDMLESTVMSIQQAMQAQYAPQQRGGGFFGGGGGGGGMGLLPLLLLTGGLGTSTSTGGIDLTTILLLSMFSGGGGF